MTKMDIWGAGECIVYIIYHVYWFKDVIKWVRLDTIISEGSDSEGQILKIPVNQGLGLSPGSESKFNPMEH